MTDPETLKQILKDAKKEIETWPSWMKTQEPALRNVPTQLEDDDVNEELSA